MVEMNLEDKIKFVKIAHLNKMNINTLSHYFIITLSVIRSALLHTPLGRGSCLKEDRNERFNYNNGDILWKKQFLKI